MSTLPPSITVSELAPGYPVYEINHPSCSARIAKHGGHVMDWRPASAAQDVLYLSPDAVFREGKAIRGGIPICWPWFNAHPSDPALPSHGYARDQFWELADAGEGESGVLITLALDLRPLAAELKIEAGEALKLTLSTFNHGEKTLPVSGALHTYLRTSDSSSVQLTGLDACRYLDTVGERVTRQQSGDIRFSEEVDRIYHSSSPVVLEDPGWKRRILVEKSGSPSTVVWNPWTEKARALGDLPDEGYRDFVCIEAAIANEAAIPLEPGSRLSLGTGISLMD